MSCFAEPGDGGSLTGALDIERRHLSGRALSSMLISVGRPCQNSGVSTRTTLYRRLSGVVLLTGLVLAFLTLSADALIARLTTIPLGRGTASITWTGATGVTPTISSIKGKAGGYQVSGSGKVPTPAANNTATSISLPSEFPIADVTGTIGGAHFTLDIVVQLPSSPSSTKAETFGHITGTFRNQPVTATITASPESRSFGFQGTIGTFRVTGVVSRPHQHRNTETARGTFNVTK